MCGSEFDIIYQLQPKEKEKRKHERKQGSDNITMSQGREAFVGSLLCCERALHATKPPKPAPMTES